MGPFGRGLDETLPGHNTSPGVGPRLSVPEPTRATAGASPPPTPGTLSVFLLPWPTCAYSGFSPASLLTGQLEC